jgi:hypothetical protein
MKTPAVIVLLFVAASFSLSGATAPAPTAPVQVAPGSQLSTQGMPADFELIINCTQLGSLLHFQIIVASRTGTFSPDSEGLLEVYDVGGRVLSCDLQKKEYSQNLLYNFDLSPKYLGKSRFSFKCTGLDAKGVATSEVVSAVLQDFVKPAKS